MLRTKDSRTVLLVAVAGVLTQHMILWIAGLVGVRDWAQLSRRGDGILYLWIAEHGYSVGRLLGDLELTWEKSDYVFYPLLPGVVRALTYTGLTFQHSALLVTSASTVIAAVLLHHFLSCHYSAFVSIAVPAMWVFQPYAIVLVSVLTESMFAMFSIFTLLAVQKRRYLLAALGVLAVCLTRITGAAIAASVLVYIIYSAWKIHRNLLKIKWQEALLLVSCVVSPLIWPIYVANILGRWDGYFYLQSEQWNSRFDGGLSLLREILSLLNFNDGVPTSMRFQIIGVASVLALLLLVLLIFNREPLLVWLPTLGVISMAVVQAGWFTVKQRFFVPAFFLFIPVAKWLESKNLFIRLGTAFTFGAMTMSMTWWISMYYIRSL